MLGRVVWRGAAGWGGLGGGCGRDFPAFAVGFGEEAVCFGKVGDLERGCVPLERLFWEAGCDIAQGDGFAEGACVVESVAGLFAF